jgi:hypothetical protein
MEATYQLLSMGATTDMEFGSMEVVRLVVRLVDEGDAGQLVQHGCHGLIASQAAVIAISSWQHLLIEGYLFSALLALAATEPLVLLSGGLIRAHAPPHQLLPALLCCLPGGAEEAVCSLKYSLARGAQDGGEVAARG